MQTDNATSIFEKILNHPVFLMVLGLVFCLGGLTALGAGSNWLANVMGVASGPMNDLVINSFAAGGCLLGYYIFARFIERKPWSDFETKGAVPEYGYGLFVGAAAMAAAVGAIAAFGGYHIVGYNFSSVVFIETLAIAIISGIPEEILLRGIIFRFLEKWLGSFAALFLSALLFGVLHLGNPNASWLAAFAIALEAGILLGAIYMVTRRLWAAIGLHMAWNSVQGGVFGIKVSGTDVNGLIVSEPRGSDWLTGGAFGAEASIPAIIICTSIGLYFLWRAHKAGQIIAPSWSRFKTGEAIPMAKADPVIG
jgi:uncharacterized protein